MDASAFATWITNLRVSRTILKIQQHHTFSPSYIHFDGNNHFERQRSMKDYHVQVNGWQDIGQHFTIFPDGSILTGRSLEQSPACIYGQNANAICIENFGNFDRGKDTMTDAQKQSIISVTAQLCKRFNIPVSSDVLVYHHWFDLQSGLRNNGTRNNKSCPGSNFFSGNKVEDCQANFLPLVSAALSSPPQDRQLGTFGRCGGHGQPLECARGRRWHERTGRRQAQLGARYAAARICRSQRLAQDCAERITMGSQALYATRRPGGGDRRKTQRADRAGQHLPDSGKPHARRADLHQRAAGSLGAHCA